MAEASDERSADADAPLRSEWFGRMLGADWVEVEPGIYEHRPLRLTEPPETSSPPAPGALDEELLENPPRTPEATEPTPSAPEEVSPRTWFGR